MGSEKDAHANPSVRQTYTTKELSRDTWTDFEKLFAKYDGVQAGCWCMFYHRARSKTEPDLQREPRVVVNRRDKESLVSEGRSHGILVYAGEDAVGSCQYGPREELPRIDAGRNYRRLDLPEADGRLWRITCFFVDRDHRRKGVAQTALRGALSSIERRGGGIVEAYPATNKKAVAVWSGRFRCSRRRDFSKSRPWDEATSSCAARSDRSANATQRVRPGGTFAMTKTPPPNTRSSRTFTSRGTNR